MRLHIDGIWIRNFRVHKMTGLGSSFHRVALVDDGADYVPFEFGPLTAFAGKNGTGKNSIFDAILFLTDILHYNVERACLKRGGFDAIHTIGAIGPTTIGLECHVEGELTPYTYAVSVQRAKTGQPFIEAEILALHGESTEPILLLQNHPRTVRYIASPTDIERQDVNAIEFCDYLHLGLGAVLYHPTYPILAAIRQTLESWYLSDFSLDIARGCSPAVSVKPPNPRGATLASLLKYQAENFTEQFLELINRAGRFVAGVKRVGIVSFREGIPQLSFELQGVPGPVPLGQMSGSALRLFTYGLLATDPSPPPLLVFVHPENGLDQANCLRFTSILESLVGNAPQATMPQMFISTNHPSILGGLQPENVWINSTDAQGHTVAQRACDDLELRQNIAAGMELTPQWFNQAFGDTI
ncbi:MAG: AAA family ATPase [Thermoguttaceae bacterium]